MWDGVRAGPKRCVWMVVVVMVVGWGRCQRHTPSLAKRGRRMALVLGAHRPCLPGAPPPSLNACLPTALCWLLCLLLAQRLRQPLLLLLLLCLLLLSAAPC